jgi:hypothetical protein
VERVALNAFQVVADVPIGNGVAPAGIAQS